MILKSEKKDAFADMSGTPTSLKRGRDEDDNELILIDNRTEKAVSSVVIPTPQRGTKDVVIGQKPHPWIPRAAPKTNALTKSVRVAGLHPSVTVEHFNDYIKKKYATN